MSGSISVSGLLQNMLDEGFNTKDCIGEMIDDSLGAGSKQIRISLDTVNKQLIFSDDGCGMSKEKLREAHVLHNRTEASEVKHGRFGIGRKHALCHFTQNKYPVNTISKSEDTGVGEKLGKGVNEIEINYADAIKNNNLELNPHAVSLDSIEYWQKHAIAERKKGTITNIRIDDKISEELADDMISSDLSKSLPYTLGLHYNQIIKDGVKMTFVLNDKEIPVVAYDPLGMSTVLPQNKEEFKIQVFMDSDTKDTRFYFSNSGKQTYRKLNPDSGLVKNFTDAMSGTYKKIGELTLTGSYSNNWTALVNPLLTKMGVGPLEETQESAELLGGIYVQRNNKIISRFATIRPGSNDFAKRNVTVNSHFLLKFQASEVIDDLFKVMTNKSKLNETNINKDLWDTVKFLREKFVNDHYHPPAPAPKPPAPAPVPVPAPAPAPPVHAETYQEFFTAIHPKVKADNPNFTPQQITSEIGRLWSLLKNKPVPAPAPAPAPGPKPVPASAPAPGPKPVPASAPAPGPKPSTPIVPVPAPTPPHDITFTKTDTEMIILVKNKEIYRVPYVGQYHQWQEVCSQALMKVGPARFMEWIPSLINANKLLV